MAIWLALALVCALVAHAAHARELRVAQNAATVHADAVFSTASAAMNALQPGDHLIIAAGTYREALSFPSRDWASATQTVIEGSGEVTINGADVVTGWQRRNAGVFDVPMPNEPAQVLVDDMPLQQIRGTVFDGYPENAASMWQPLHRDQGGIWPGRKQGDERSLPPNSFWFDASHRRLYIRLSAGDPALHRVEVSKRTYSLFGDALANVTVRNLSFRLGNTSVSSRAGLVTLKGNHILVDHVTVSEADSVGIEVDGDDNRMTHVIANDCGQLGIKARGARMSIEASETDFNNTRGFNKWWEAGGAKFIGGGGLRDSVVSAHRAIGNHGDGIWFDWKNSGNRIENSRALYNSGMGIQYEASEGASIVGNIVVGNGQRGIYLPHSSRSLVAHNLVAANVLEGVAIVDEGRQDPEGTFDLRPRANRVQANVIAWNGGSLILPRNRADNTADENVYVSPFDAGQFALGWRAPVFSSFAAWKESTAQDSHSVFIAESIDGGLSRTVKLGSPSVDLGWYETLRATLAQSCRNVGNGQRAATPCSDDAAPGPAVQGHS